MCGLTGFLGGFDVASVDAVGLMLRRMTDAIEHRGPDSDGHWLETHHRQSIEKLMQALNAAQALSDAAAVEAATQALAKGTEAFAAERMNRGIQQALAGKNVESL